jgi:hypothetical protein
VCLAMSVFDAILSFLSNGGSVGDLECAKPETVRIFSFYKFICVYSLLIKVEMQFQVFYYMCRVALTNTLLSLMLAKCMQALY